MGGMTLEPVDYVIAVVLLIAVLRGLARGLLRETFSIASLAAAIVEPPKQAMILRTRNTSSEACS